MIYVTNNGKKALTDYFDGKPYVFEPGKSVSIPVEVAEHIFGYGKDDKLPNLIRLGWIRISSEMDSAMQRLGEFSFSMNPPQTIHSSSPVDKDRARGWSKQPPLAKSDVKQAVTSA
jgi:hypothetical protein